MQPGKSDARGVFGSIRAQEWIKHKQMRVINFAALAQFYIDVYEFKQEEKALEGPNFYPTDGKVTLVLAPWKN